MRVLQVHNHHLVEGGSDMMFRTTVSLLQDAGHEVFVYERHNAEVSGIVGKLHAAASGIYSPTAKRDVARLIERARPEVAHLHNLYPLVSPSVLDACEEARVPVLMRLPDFTLLCPTSHCFRRGEVCERCFGGREYQCVLTNCRGDIMTSAAYALRTMVARLRGCFVEKVSLFAAPSEFVRRRFVAEGFPVESMAVIPNAVAIPEEAASPAEGSYVAYVGRVSPEKGVRVLVEAARLTGLPVRVAGDVASADESSRGAPANVEFVGKLRRGEHLDAFLRSARFVVAPSLCYESFNLACAEAMAHGLPVIASRIGALPEVVEDGETGLLFQPGDVSQLAEHMQRLWDAPEAIQRMGAASRHKAAGRYSPAAYCRRLLELYRAALGRRPRCAAQPAAVNT